MRHTHRTRRGAVLVATTILTVGFGLIDTRPVHADCKIDISLQNRLRRVRGQVNVECGDECWPSWPFCHTAPYGNWGVNSNYGPRMDTDQFHGWKPHGSQRQWNSCTGSYTGSSYYNDGLGRQKGAPDDERRAGEEIIWESDHCRNVVPEVYTKRRVYMEIYELDWDYPDLVTTLNFGTISFSVDCPRWNYCYGASSWRYRHSGDATKVSAEGRIVYKAVWENTGRQPPPETR